MFIKYVPAYPTEMETTHFWVPYSDYVVNSWLWFSLLFFSDLDLF